MSDDFNPENNQQLSSFQTANILETAPTFFLDSMIVEAPIYRWQYNFETILGPANPAFIDAWLSYKDIANGYMLAYNPNGILWRVNAAGIPHLEDLEKFYEQQRVIETTSNSTFKTWLDDLQDKAAQLWVKGFLQAQGIDSSDPQYEEKLNAEAEILKQQQQQMLEDVIGLYSGTKFSRGAPKLVSDIIKGSSKAAPEAAESSFKFTQTTASARFSKEGIFSGKTIGEVVDDLRAGVLKASDVPVEYIERDGVNLIVNTRSSLALKRAGVPESEWNLINKTGNPLTEATITKRLAKNKLPDEGADVLRITGPAKNASNLE
ncbi:MAG TPA: hypothetical protein VGL27_02140 [Negativicutes bacterium]|jgi:hypothetical protein